MRRRRQQPPRMRATLADMEQIERDLDLLHKEGLSFQNQAGNLSSFALSFAQYVKRVAQFTRLEPNRVQELFPDTPLQLAIETKRKRIQDAVHAIKELLVQQEIDIGGIDDVLRDVAVEADDPPVKQRAYSDRRIQEMINYLEREGRAFVELYDAMVSDINDHTVLVDSRDRFVLKKTHLESIRPVIEEMIEDTPYVSQKERLRSLIDAADAQRFRLDILVRTYQQHNRFEIVNVQSCESMFDEERSKFTSLEANYNTLQERLETASAQQAVTVGELVAAESRIVTLQGSIQEALTKHRSYEQALLSMQERSATIQKRASDDLATCSVHIDTLQRDLHEMTEARNEALSDTSGAIRREVESKYVSRQNDLAALEASLQEQIASLELRQAELLKEKQNAATLMHAAQQKMLEAEQFRSKLLEMEERIHAALLAYQRKIEFTDLQIDDLVQGTREMATSVKTTLAIVQEQGQRLDNAAASLSTAHLAIQVLQRQHKSDHGEVMRIMNNLMQRLDYVESRIGGITQPDPELPLIIAGADAESEVAAVTETQPSA